MSKDAYDRAPRIPRNPHMVSPSHCPVPMDDADDTAPLDMGPFIRTVSGRIIHILHPREADFTVDDIAWGLSSTNRYGGQAKPRYNVAEHSIHVMRWLRDHGWPAHVQRYGLFHDSPEAYLNDITKPLKMLLPPYDIIEDGFMRVIENRFQLRVTRDERAAVKQADLVMLSTEGRILMGPDFVDGTRVKLEDPWPPGEPLCWSPDIAYQRFLDAAAGLGIS